MTEEGPQGRGCNKFSGIGPPADEQWGWPSKEPKLGPYALPRGSGFKHKGRIQNLSLSGKLVNTEPGQKGLRRDCGGAHGRWLRQG